MSLYISILPSDQFNITMMGINKHNVESNWWDRMWHSTQNK